MAPGIGDREFQGTRTERSERRASDLNEIFLPSPAPVALYCPRPSGNIRKQKSFAHAPKSWTRGRHGPADAQYPRRRGRPRDADADREISARQRLQRRNRERRPRDVSRDGRPSRRPPDPRCHAARRGRPQPVPQGARAVADADHHADRARRGRSTASSASRWAPTTIWPSRSTRANCWPASTRCCAGRPPACTASTTEGATALSFAGWRIDLRLRELRNPEGARVAMTSAEFDLLRTFCERPGRVLSRDSLLDLTQGRNAGSFERSIDVLVSRIRRKIEPDPQNRHHDQDRALRRLHVHAAG